MSDEEYENEQSTPEEQLQIADFFIMSSPRGEVNEVVKDVKKLINSTEEILTNEKLSEILGNYNVENMISAVASDTGEKVLVSETGRVSANTFVDPSTGNVHTMNHVDRKFTSTTDQKQVLSPEVEAQRKAIARAARDYLVANYSEGKSVNTTYGSDDGLITVCTSAENINLGAFWTGSIRSTYTVNVSSSGSAELNCNMKINSHYFESANVQLAAEKSGTKTVTIGDAKTSARSIATAIDDFETEYQNNLEEMYVEMHRNTFKSMRQFLPPNKQFMNWNIGAHNVARSVGS
jgi:hypothetical protein